MLLQKAEQVKMILEEAEIKTTCFQRNHGLNCTTNCGTCCLKSDLEATVLEFIPAAIFLYKTGSIEKVWNRLENTSLDGTCLFYGNMEEAAGNCQVYSHRALICRLFGFSTMTNKHEHLELITCKSIKHGEAYAILNQEKLKAAPLASAFYLRLGSIDFSIGVKTLPVNLAIRKAMDIVYSYFWFNNKKTG